MEALHHAWGSMVDRVGLPGMGPLFHLRKLRGDGTVNDSQIPRDLKRGENPTDFARSWLQGVVDADCAPYLWSPCGPPQLMAFEPADPGQARPRWFNAPWGHGMSFNANGQRFGYERPSDYWAGDFSIVLEANTSHPRSDGHVVWGDAGLGWIKLSGSRNSHFALARGTANPELHAIDPSVHTLGLVGHVRMAVVKRADEVLIVVDGKAVYRGATTGTQEPDPLASPVWGGIVGHGNNFEGELVGGAMFTAALDLHQAMDLTSPLNHG